MTKNSEKRFLFATIFLTILLISSAYATLVPKVNATVITTKQKGLTILNDVIGVDLTKYTATTQEYPQNSYLGVAPQENVRCNVESNGNKLDIFYNFVNGQLQEIHVLEGEGSSLTTKTATTDLEKAEDFLNNYQSYSGNSFYGELKSTLNNIDASKSLTTTIGNTKLDVTASGSSTTFRWTYAYDGVEAPVKCVALDYENGFLKYFIDNWNLYRIGSTSINLSEKEATDNGLAQAQSFSWKVGSGNNTYEVRDFNATQAMVWETIFSNSLSAETARNHDPLTLYPMRHVWVSLDKFYPGNVYGIEVFLWADTKEVYNIQERFSTLDPPADLVATSNDKTSVDSTKVNSVSVPRIVIPAVGAIAIGASTLLFARRKKLPKLKALKIGGTLLCVLLSSSMLLLPISGVYAVDRSSLIWGSRSSGAYDPGLSGATWRKHPNELGNQSATAASINASFGSYGNYSGAHDYQGPNSVKDRILENISYTQNNYPFTAVIDFDHGVGLWYPDPPGYFHFMFEDDVGTLTGTVNNNVTVPENGVYDNEIFDATGGTEEESRVFFAFISTCKSAALSFPNESLPLGGGFLPDGSASGMPFAWTHRNVRYNPSDPSFNTAYNMSLFGYSQPDSGDYCYIGFPNGSAALAQTSIQSGFTQLNYANWLQGFFNIALRFDFSVKDALDEDSLASFTMDFDETDLYTGFTAIWPMWNQEQGWHNTSYGYNWDTLAVYGNGNMHLRAPELTVNAFDSNGNPISANVYIDSQYAGTTGNTFRVSVPDYHTVQVNSGSYTFQNFTGYSNFENPISVYVDEDTTVTANYYSNPPPQYKLTVSSGSGGSTSLSSGDHYYTPQEVAVTAYPDNDYVFDYWLLDETQHYENPISVPMSNDHTLQATFRLANPHWVTVNVYNQYYYTGSCMPVWVDGQYAGATDYSGSFSVFLPEGTHWFGVAEYVDDYYDNYIHFDYPQLVSHTLQYLYVNGNYEYSSETYFSVTSDKTVEAWYNSDG